MPFLVILEFLYQAKLNHWLEVNEARLADTLESKNELFLFKVPYIAPYTTDKMDFTPPRQLIPAHRYRVCPEAPSRKRMRSKSPENQDAQNAVVIVQPQVPNVKRSLSKMFEQE